MQPVTLLLATLKAMGTAAIMAAAGVLATKKGLITNPGRRCLAELSMNIFMPALLFSSVVSCSKGQACVPVVDLIAESWYLFLFPLVVVGSGILLGSLVASATGCPASFRKACIGSVAFANSTGMSITLLGILGPILLEAGVVETDPLKYQPVYLILYPILQWSVGSYLFGLSGKKQAQEEEKTAGKQAADGQAPLQDDNAAAQVVSGDAVARRGSLQSGMSVAAMDSMNSLMSGRVSMAAMRSLSSLNSAREVAVRSTLSFLEPADIDLAHEPDTAPLDLPVGAITTMRTIAESPSTSEASTVDTVDPEAGSARVAGEPSEVQQPSGRLALVKRVAKGLGSLFRHAVVPPVIGAVLGVIVAAIVPLRAQLVDVSDTGASPPLELLLLALQSIGRASVPVNMLVLGSNLAQGANLRAVPCRTTLGIIFMKQLGQPLMIGAFIYLLARVLEGSTSVFLVMIIMSCTPTANNLMVMVELSGQSKEAMTANIFAQYLAAPVVMTLVITGFLIVLQSPWYLP